MGGFYERLVGFVKQSLRKSIGKICLNVDQCKTVLTEVEAVLNSRPLVYVGADLNSGFTLTPAHFLNLNPKPGIPHLDTADLEQDPDFLDRMSSSQKLLETWRKGQKHLDIFSKLWFNEYVLSLCERTQKMLKTPRIQSAVHPSKGDVVLLKDNSLRALVSNFQESGDRSENSNFFLFAQKDPIGELFSKIIFKSSSEFLFWQKLGKFEIGLNVPDGPIEIMQISTFSKLSFKNKETFSRVDVFTIVLTSLVLASKLYFIST